MSEAQRSEGSQPGAAEFPEVDRGDGYAFASLEQLGSGPGFRKVRAGLSVKAFGVNAIVLPPGIETGFHSHKLQEELYFVHSGQIEIELGDGSVHPLGPGGLARIDAPVWRKVRNVGEIDAVYLCAGGRDGYIGRDGLMRDDEEARVQAVRPAASGQTPPAASR